MPQNDNHDAQWERFRAGEAAALGAIYDQHVRALYGYGHRLTPNRALVEDSIQDVFAELWKRRKRIRPTTSAKFYLLVALRRKIVRELKKQRTMLPLEEALHVSHTIQNSLSDEQAIALREALAQLGPRQQEAIYLRFYNRLTNDEIAELMEIDKRTVYNLVSQALARLNRRLKPVMHYLLGWLTLLLTTS
jgi:RNA polymerase sigma factor (sigma-70 family)